MSWDDTIHTHRDKYTVSHDQNRTRLLNVSSCFPLITTQDQYNCTTRYTHFPRASSRRRRSRTTVFRRGINVVGRRGAEDLAQFAAHVHKWMHNIRRCNETQRTSTNVKQDVNNVRPRTATRSLLANEVSKTNIIRNWRDAVPDSNDK